MLIGRYVLIAEDDYFVAQELARAVEKEGAVVLGPHPSVAGVMATLEAGQVTAATLDVELRDGRSYVIAQALHDRCIPFVFATGHHCRDLPPGLAASVRVAKPCRPCAVLAALKMVIAGTADD